MNAYGAAVVGQSNNGNAAAAPNNGGIANDINNNTGENVAYTGADIGVNGITAGFSTGNNNNINR